MILHTSLSQRQVRMALTRAQAAGLVTPDVGFAVFGPRRSRTHQLAIEVQLGTTDKHSLPEGTVDQRGKRMRVRRYKNSGSHGAASEWAIGRSLYAATWHEWGWFMAGIFTADPRARFGGLTGWGYKDAADFHVKTGGLFRNAPGVPDRCQCQDRMAAECEANGRSCAPLIRVPLNPAPLAFRPAMTREQESLLLSRRDYSRPPGAGVNITLRREDTGEAIGELGEGYQPDLGPYANPDYVSPAVQRAREQLRSSEELFTDHIDQTVFGPRQ